MFFFRRNGFFFNRNGGFKPFTLFWGWFLTRNGEIEEIDFQYHEGLWKWMTPSGSGVNRKRTSQLESHLCMNISFQLDQSGDWNWKLGNQPTLLVHICFDFMHLDMQSLRMKRHQKRLRKRNQPRRKRRRKIVLETSWNMICFCMIMINTSYLKWIRFYLVCVFLFCCKKKWVQLGMVGFLVLPMFFRAHAFCVREGSRVRHQILSKTQDPNCTKNRRKHQFANSMWAFWWQFCQKGCSWCPVIPSQLKCHPKVPEKEEKKEATKETESKAWAQGSRLGNLVEVLLILLRIWTFES